MACEADRVTEPVAPDIDESGIDRAQVRAFLALTAAERLRALEAHAEAVLEIREINAGRLR